MVHQPRGRRTVVRARVRHRVGLAAAVVHDPVAEGRICLRGRLSAIPRDSARAEAAHADRREQPSLYRSPPGTSGGVLRGPGLDPADRRERGTHVTFLEDAWKWMVAHAARIWGFALFGLVLAVSWHTLRGIHTRDFRVALHSLDVQDLTLVAVLTILNVAVMGFYDVLAFRHTRTRPMERWRFGAVAFCWSNFLTLG